MKTISRNAAYWFIRIAALAVPLWQLGCGATPPVTVGAITQSNGQIVLPVSEGATKSTVTLTNAVTGGFNANTGVVWSVKEANGGTIDQNGVYTAPETAGTFTVIATPNAKPENSVTLVIKVVPTLTVSPTEAAVATNGPLTLTATVKGTNNQAIVWSVKEGTSGGTAPTGNGLTGIYTAPNTEGTFHVMATLQADNSIQVSVPVIVKAFAVPPGVSVSISPMEASAIVGDTIKFKASVSNSTNQTVTWIGTKDANSGDFVATTAGDFMVTATSMADPTKSMSAPVHIMSRLTITTSASTVVVVGTTPTIQFAAKVGSTDVTSAVTWTSNAGTISAGGLLTLPTTHTNSMGDTITVKAKIDGQPDVLTTVTLLPVGTSVAPADITVNNIPDASNSVVVELLDSTNNDNVLISQIKPRSTFTSAGTKSTVVSFLTLPARLLKVRVTARPGADATGVVQADNLSSALPTVTPATGATAIANLKSTINTVTITAVPNSASVIYRNTAPTLTLTAKDSNGMTVPVLASDIVWKSSVPGFASVPITGIVTGAGTVTNVPVTVAPGVTDITAQETVSSTDVNLQKKATYTLTVLSDTGSASGDVRSAKSKGK